ncbi:hypothetical protein L6452_25634 [Arctium lappa]|uniref:Uncharacterized protein n=1 Tax=Arctium lappa TaxID=4217 RepID=A0ACB9ABU9_ARCLA|nr:hypothetical protein L6452_25634 [Arctium lappa]
MTSLSLPCSYKKESLLRIESTHIEFSKDFHRCLPSNIVHPVDGEKRYAIEKSASALRQVVDFIRELNCRKVSRKMEFLDFLTRPRLRVLWTLRPPATSGSKHLEGNFHREGFNPATGSLRLPCYDFTPVEDPTVSSVLAAIKLKRTLEKKGLRLRKAPATFLLTAQLRAGTQLVALARHSAPRLTSAAKTFSLGACLSNTKRGFRSL